METSGPKSPSFYPVEQTTILKIDSTRHSKGSWKCLTNTTSLQLTTTKISFTMRVRPARTKQTIIIQTRLALVLHQSSPRGPPVTTISTRSRTRTQGSTWRQFTRRRRLMKKVCWSREEGHLTECNLKSHLMKITKYSALLKLRKISIKGFKPRPHLEESAPSRRKTSTWRIARSLTCQ